MARDCDGEVICQKVRLETDNRMPRREWQEKDGVFISSAGSRHFNQTHRSDYRKSIGNLWALTSTEWTDETENWTAGRKCLFLWMHLLLFHAWLACPWPSFSNQRVWKWHDVLARGNKKERIRGEKSSNRLKTGCPLTGMVFIRKRAWCC